MQQAPVKGKRDNVGIPQEKLILSLEKLTKKLIHNLEQDLSPDFFEIDQREKLLQALKLSEKVFGPIGSTEKTLLWKLQQDLENLIQLKIIKSQDEIVDHTSKTKDLLKYNLKNVR